MRQILIGAATPVASNISAGLEADGAIGVQKMNNGVATDLLAGDTIADAPAIRLIQGTAAENIVTPWIYGKDVIAWNGNSYVDSNAHTYTLTVTATTTTNKSTATLKYIKRDTKGNAAEFKSYSFDYAASDNASTIAGGIRSAITAAGLPAFVKTSAGSGATVIPTGYKVGELDGNGDRVLEAYSIDFAWEGQADTVNVVTIAKSSETTPDKGVGTPYAVAAMEDSLAGSGFGYYNRILRPKGYNDAAGYTDVAGNFDMYTIVATKDGSTSPQIKGVDNLMEFYIALDNGDATVTSALEGKLNPWMASAGFGNVNL